MAAVMAKYNPFAEKAGMQKIAEQPPPKEAVRIAEILSQLGFNIHLLSSEKYVLNKLQSLSTDEIRAIKEAFIKNSHPRFIKIFQSHMPYGKKENYERSVEEAGMGKIAQLIKAAGFLLQTKAYLFWRGP
ncbi:hypothetical protein KEJ28_04370, partial [Candidatus Bathyarchaeota archaeon]|nr:hypothetical protein [Candidatus Bathyarchaeota archaeon]